MIKIEKDHTIPPKVSSKKKKAILPLLFYFSLLIFFALFIWVTAVYITPLISISSLSPISSTNSPFQIFTQSVKGHISSTLGRLLLQIITILIVSRAIGWLFTKIKQPTVIGEIVAGILLGPSLLGTLAPSLFQALFPPDSILFLELLSSFGLILFMFTIGMELRLADIRKQARDSLVISQSSTLIPFVLGMGMAIFLYQSYSPDVAFFPMALFMGIAMSITAFPVLARIIQEKQMNQTPFGKLTLNTAATGDIFAWLLLAAIMAVAQSGSFVSALYNFLFLLIYIAVMFGVVRPLFKLIGKVYHKQELITKTLVALIFILLLASAYLTEILSMHALFGAFIFGLIMPEDLRFRHHLTEKVEDVSLNIFLPLFFVSSGLKTDLTLINSWEMGFLSLLMIALAVIGKVGGTYMGARVCGLSKKESIYLGAYMNTRGLMELVVLKIGLDLGILPPLLFAILVLMTVVTTLMTSPMLHLIDWWLKIKKKYLQRDEIHSSEILISFARPETGIALLSLANQIFSKEKRDKGVVAMHATLNSTLSTIDEESYYYDNFHPLQEKAKSLEFPIKPLYHITDNISNSIIEEANKGAYHFLLLGAGLSLSRKKEDQEIVLLRDKLHKRWQKLTLRKETKEGKAITLLDERMAHVTEATATNVGVLVGGTFLQKPKRIALVSQIENKLLQTLAEQMASNNNGELFNLKGNTPTDCNWSDKYDFLFITKDAWHKLVTEKPLCLEKLPPTLIVKTR